MIFASDLDRTLLYSTRSAGDYNGKVTVVETTKANLQGFMSDYVIEKLTRYSSLNTFIPVTTRTMEQYKRIEIFQTTLVPDYAIVANGAEILCDGELDHEWKETIAHQHSNYLSQMKELKLKVHQLGLGELTVKEADGYFIYLVFSTIIYESERTARLRDWCNSIDWTMSLQGRKIYFIPNYISKSKALSYLQSKYSLSQPLIAAGDSLLDYNLMSMADYGIAPKHGEVCMHYPQLNQTNHTGIEASNEIIDLVIGFAGLKLR